MKKLSALLLFMVSPALVSLAGSVVAPYEIGTWRGFRPAAISYTFDDDLPNQYAVAVPMFNARNFKLTLFTVTTWVPGDSWAPLQNAALSGHEIASHTVTHPRLSGLSAEKQTNELANSQQTINANVTNASCVTIAYPYCVEGDTQITSKYYIAARGCSGQLVPATPADFMNISSFVCGTEGSIKTPEDFNHLADRAAAANAWAVYLIHAIDKDKGYSPLPGATLQASVDYLAANTNKFWVETFGNVVRYIKERNAVSIGETSSQESRIVLQVTHDLDPSIFNYPITVRRPLPVGWAAATVSQNQQPVHANIVSVNSAQYVMFDVVPNGGEIVLSKAVETDTLRFPRSF